MIIRQNCVLFYRYKNMAEFSNKDRSDEPKNLEPDWSYNIGEAVLDIDAVTLSSFEVGILVLGERNLYCLNDNCVSLKYSKRLEYKALCFQAYVIGTIDSGIRNFFEKERKREKEKKRTSAIALSRMPRYFDLLEIFPAFLLFSLFHRERKKKSESEGTAPPWTIAIGARCDTPNYF